MANINYNKVILGGRITKDIELKTTPKGTMVTSFSVAVKDRSDTNFFDVVAWKETAEFIYQYFKKGSSILLEGSLQKRSYEKDGKKHYITEVIANRVYFVDSKNESGFVEPAPVAEAIPEPHFEEVPDDEELPF